MYYLLECSLLFQANIYSVASKSIYHNGNQIKTPIENVFNKTKLI
jgi:hypothetical protein